MPAAAGAARGIRRGIPSSSRAVPMAHAACTSTPRRCCPPQFDAVVQVVSHLEIGGAVARVLGVSVHAEPSLRVYKNLRAASSDASTLSNSAFTSATLFCGASHTAPAAARHDRKSAHHVDRDQRRKSRAGVAKSSHAPVVSKKVAPSGISARRARCSGTSGRFRPRSHAPSFALRAK